MTKTKKKRNGKKIEVYKDGSLYLNNKNIKDIDEIKGFKSLVNLQELHINNNQIPEDLIKELGNDPKKNIVLFDFMKFY